MDSDGYVYAQATIGGEKTYLGTLLMYCICYLLIFFEVY